MNWGNKLLLTFVVFVSGMAYLVYRSTNVNFELVEKDYYKSELRYQDVIEGTKHANELESSTRVIQDSQGIKVQLPEEMKSRQVSGSIWFYCAYDESNDKKINLEPDREGAQLIPQNQLRSGNYIVRVSWSSEGKLFFSEQKLTVLK